MNRYPGRLHHHTPPWVETGATFHIRISLIQKTRLSLTDPGIASHLLSSAQFYHEHERWHCRLFLLMPDHIHALLVFPYDQPMHTIIAAWKGFQAKRVGLKWQNNFFDHRIRNHHELKESDAYIRLNPVRKGFCVNEKDWPWVITCS